MAAFCIAARPPESACGDCGGCFVRVAFLAAFFSLLTIAVTGCGGFQSSVLTTKVIPLSNEDLAGPCTFNLYFPDAVVAQKGVLVVYERGDSSVIFNDVQVRQQAATLGYAMVFARQCNASSYDDIQSDPTKGPGRALFQALDQFATATGHPELASAKVVLYGFSAAAVLAAEMTSFAPQRIAGIVAYAAGSAHVDIQTFVPSAAALQVPSLFLDNAQDEDSGTYRSYVYFTRGRQSGARWGFGVQNQVSHCCNATTEPLLLPWLQEVATAGPPAAASGASPASTTAFVCSPDGTIDAQNDEDCSITSALIGSPPSPSDSTGWLPGSQSAAEWLTWVTNQPPSSN